MQQPTSVSTNLSFKSTQKAKTTFKHLDASDYPRYPPRLSPLCIRTRWNAVLHFDLETFAIPQKYIVVLQKTQEQPDRLPPPRTKMMDFTLTHTRFGLIKFAPYRTTYTHKAFRWCSWSRWCFLAVVRFKIRHYRQLYLNRPDPDVFLPMAVDTLGRIYDDVSRLLYLHAHREAPALAIELPETAHLPTMHIIWHIRSWKVCLSGGVPLEDINRHCEMSRLAASLSIGSQQAGIPLGLNKYCWM